MRKEGGRKGERMRKEGGRKGERMGRKGGRMGMQGGKGGEEGGRKEEGIQGRKEEGGLEGEREEERRKGEGWRRERCGHDGCFLPGLLSLIPRLGSRIIRSWSPGQWRLCSAPGNNCWSVYSAFWCMV